VQKDVGITAAGIFQRVGKDGEPNGVEGTSGPMSVVVGGLRQGWDGGAIPG
jgi:hypothetical protein